MASKNIRGVTIEIGADTTKFVSGIKSLDSEINKTSRSLKDVNNLLKLDPTNTELLRQKQEMLSGSIAKTKEKLEALKQGAQAAAEELANTGKGQESYDAIQREIIETENDLRDLERQAAESNETLQKIAQAGEKLKSAGNAVSGAGKALLPVTGAVAAAGTASVKTAADFDSAMSQVAAVSGATGDDLESLRDKAREMGATTKFSASEAAEAMNYMAMAGWKTQDMLSGVEGIMNLAAASGEDLGTTSDIVTDALTAFGLSAQDSGHFADILAAASSNANTNVSMMGETFKYAAPVAGALGFSAEDTAEAIGLMANSGIKGSQAGTALRTIMNSLNGDLTFSSAALGDVTVATTNADGSMRSLSDILADCRGAFDQMSESEQASNAKTVFGTEAMSGFLSLMNAAPSDIEKLAGAISTCSAAQGGYNGTAAQMAAVMQDNLNGQVTILKSALEELAISFGEILMPAVQNIVDMLQQLANWLNSLPTGVQQTIVAVALLVAALGPVLIVVGKVMTAVGQIMTWAPKIVSFISTIPAKLAALQGIATTISGVVAVVVGAATAIKNFVDMWVNGFSLVKDIIMGVGVALAAVGAVILGAPALVAAIVAGVVYAVANLVLLVKEHFEEIKAFLATLWDSISTAVTNVWQTITTSISSFVTTIVTWVTTNLDAMASRMSSIWELIKTAASAAWELVKTLILGPVLLLCDLVTGNFDKLASDASKIWEKIKSAASTLWNAIKTLVVEIAKLLWEGVKEKFESLKQSVSEIWESVKTFVVETATKLKDDAIQAFENMKTSIGETVSKIPDVVKEGFQGAIDFITGLPEQAFQWGADFINGLADGIRDAASAVGDAVEDIADTITDWLHFSCPDKGPLAEYESWMPDMMKGLASGISGNMWRITDELEKLTGQMSLNVNGFGEGMKSQPIVVRSYNQLMLDGKVIAETVNEQIGGML